MYQYRFLSFWPLPSLPFLPFLPFSPPSPLLTLFRSKKESYLLKPQLQLLQLALLDHERLVVQVFDDVVVFVLVDLEDDGFDGGVAFDEDA